MVSYVGIREGPYLMILITMEYLYYKALIGRCNSDEVEFVDFDLCDRVCLFFSEFCSDYV